MTDSAETSKIEGVEMSYKKEDNSEIEKIEDGFEILTMESVDQKVDQDAEKEVKEEEEESCDASQEVKVDQNAEVEPVEVDKAGHEGVEKKEEEEGSLEKNSKDNAWDWNNWSDWGTSVINTAASSVTTFTTQVGDGLFQVLETVESGLLTQKDDEGEEGRSFKEEPNKDQTITNQDLDPKLGKMERDVKEENVAEGVGKGGGRSWWLSSLSNVVSKTTSVVQQTTNVVVHGGLDMLETIGKKTYDVITEGDHGLKRVIEQNEQRKQMPNLSLVLKEVREIAELKMKEEESLLETKKFLYSYWFDEYQGLVQLEAFELLANQNEVRSREEYDRLPKEKLGLIKKKLAELNEIYKVAEEDNEEEEDEVEDIGQDFHQLLLDYAAKLPVVVSVQKLLECQEQCKAWLAKHKELSPMNSSGEYEHLIAKDVLKKSMQCLAQMTALSIQHFHKLAQLVTRIPTDSPSPFASVSVAETARSVVDFTQVINREMSACSSEFVSMLGKFESCEESVDRECMKKDHITTIYLEASNSSNFVQKSLKLLLPALQVAVMTTD